MKMLLFDIDLTLIDTGGAGVRALNRAIEEILDLGEALQGVAPHGKTDPAIVREACLKGGLRDIDRIEAVTGTILERYVSLLEHEIAQSANYSVLPGIREVLEEVCTREDIVLGLATGNVEQGARIKLERGGLNPYFPFGGFGSDSEDRTEVVRHAVREGFRWKRVDVAPENTFVIGDTPKDVAAGRLAGFRTIAVATGHHGTEELERTGADLVIEDFSTGRDQFLRSTRIA